MADETRNCLEMPDEIMGGMILQRLNAVEILTSAQKVCRDWRRICKDPAMWKVIYMDDGYDPRYDIEKLCKQAVHRSCGELIDISLRFFGSYDLLVHISRCSSKLNRLCLRSCYDITGCELSNAVKMLPHLETLELYDIDCCAEDIEAIGRNCPQLKSFTMKRDYTEHGDDVHAHAIANSMPALRHLMVVGTMDNDKVQAILNGCPHLESVPYLQWTITIATNHIHRSSVLNITGDEGVVYNATLDGKKVALMKPVHLFAIFTFTLSPVIGCQFLQRCWHFIENLFNGVDRCGQILHLIRWDFDFAILSINP
ncbi:hypothetical protein OSB04_001916 [Centaurea solstitialis]|uniref:F-box domain-containing protein n=1 Tax=Centaurea solstitialis TaxID=347529 RepID=A0AA38TRX5_9ASTR|nr:hypothetical protein OSB04_001916 [Centaurea solstitialis]